MTKLHRVPQQTTLHMELQQEAIRVFKQIGEKNSYIREIRIAGPWVPENYKPGQMELILDKISGVTYGVPTIHVGIITSQDIYEQDTKPVLENKKMYGISREFEQKFGVNVVVRMTPSKELNGTMLSLQEAEAYMFGDKTEVYTPVLCKQ